MFWKIAPLALVFKYLELSLKKNGKAQKITNMLRTSLTLDTENKNLGMVMKYFLTRLTNLNCNFILTESVPFLKTSILLLQTDNCIKKSLTP